MKSPSFTNCVHHNNNIHQLSEMEIKSIYYLAQKHLVLCAMLNNKNNISNNMEANNVLRVVNCFLVPGQKKRK